MKKSQKSYFEKELQKAVHAHNEKIRYHETKGAKHLPERESFAKLKSLLETKKDYQGTIAELRSFGKRGAEKGVRVSENLIISEWEKSKIESEVRQRNRIAKAQKVKFEELEVTNLNKPMGYKRGEQSTLRGAEFNPKKLNWESFRSRSELEMYKKSLKAQTTSTYWKKRHETLQMNYIQGLYNTYGPRAYKLMKKISEMPNKEFMKKYNAEQNATLDFIYDKFDQDVKFDALTLIWTGEESDVDIEEFLEI